MTQQLRVLYTFLQKTQVWFLETTWEQTSIYNSNFRGQCFLLPLWIPSMHIVIHPYIRAKTDPCKIKLSQSLFLKKIQKTKNTSISCHEVLGVLVTASPTYFFLKVDSQTVNHPLGTRKLFPPLFPPLFTKGKIEVSWRMFSELYSCQMMGLRLESGSQDIT